MRPQHIHGDIKEQSTPSERRIMEPTNVEIMPNDLAINWSDGHESYIDFVTLRNACPCAA